MAGISYIRDATRRKKKPPATIASPGIDYIRTNTRKEVESRNAATKAAARKAGTAQASTPTAPQSSNTPSSTPTPAPAPAPKAPKVKKPPKAVAPAAPGAAPAEPGMNPISGIFNSARRELDRQESIAGAQMEARLADQRAFDEYVARVRSASNQTLGDQFATTAANAQAAREASLANVAQYTNQAISAAGGNQSVLAAAGTPEALGGQAIQGAATAADSADAQALQSVLMQYQVGQEGGDLARSANMRSNFEADRRQSLAEIAQRRFDLSQEQAKAEIEQQNADRQYELDKVVADYMRAKGESELGLAAYNAETERIGTRTPEERARELEMNASRIEAQNAKDRASAGAAADPAEAASSLNKWYNDTVKQLGFPSVDAMPDGNSRIEFGRRAVQQLKAMTGNNLTAEQAVDILRGILPAHVMDEGYPQGDSRNRVMAAILAKFK